MALLGTVGAMPQPMQKMILQLISKKATAVMTNVPGPTQTLYMAGAKMTQVMFWVPQSNDLGLGVSILSYGGGVQFGVITSKKLCPHPNKIIERFEPEFEKLVLAAMMVGPSLATDPQEAEFELFPQLKDRYQPLNEKALKQTNKTVNNSSKKSAKHPSQSSTTRRKTFSKKAAVTHNKISAPN